MALGLFFMGLILVVSGIKGTQSQLASLLASEFSGAGNFWAFIFGLAFLGMLGYIPGMRNTSRALICLTLLVLMLSNRGFWSNLVEAVNNPQPIAAAPTTDVPKAVDVEAAGKSIATGVASSIAKLGVDAVGMSGAGGAGIAGTVVSGIIGALF